jgi:hypothetical protein
MKNHRRKQNIQPQLRPSPVLYMCPPSPVLYMYPPTCACCCSDKELDDWPDDRTNLLNQRNDVVEKTHNVPRSSTHKTICVSLGFSRLDTRETYLTLQCINGLALMLAQYVLTLALVVVWSTSWSRLPGLKVPCTVPCLCSVYT